MVFKDLTARITLDLRRSEPGAERKVDFLKRLDETFEKKIINHLNRMGYKPFSMYLSMKDKELFQQCPNYDNDIYFGLQVFISNITNPRFGIFVTGRNQKQPNPTQIISSLVPCDLLV